MIPKKLQLKDSPDIPEFEGRDVYKPAPGSSTNDVLNSLGLHNPYEVVLHSGGYYSVPKKTKKTK